MKTCLFCYNRVNVGIHSYCGNDHTVKDDILQFFGHQIEDRLYSDDGVCIFCQKLMNALAKLKRRLLPLIYREESETPKPVNFQSKYDIFTSLNYDDDDDRIECSKSPTPNLVQCKSVIRYDSKKEGQLAELEQNRSASRVSVVSATSVEIDKAFSKKGSTRKRKKGHNWSRRKNGKYSRASNTSRAGTSMSGVSTRSRHTDISMRRSPDSPTSLCNNNFDLDELSAPQLTFKIGPNQQKSLDACGIRNVTNAIAPEQEDEMLYLLNEIIRHPCNQEDCDFMSESLDSLVEHKIKEHNCLALYWCHCGKKYTTSQELKEHKDTHVDEIVCDICHQIFDIKEQFSAHWETEHLKNSVMCPYCNRRFMSENSCNKHVSFEHKNRTISRIDFAEGVDQVSAQNEGFQVRLLVQHPPVDSLELTL